MWNSYKNKLKKKRFSWFKESLPIMKLKEHEFIEKFLVEIEEIVRQLKAT